ncbi:type II secretion system GspH family protein [Candidatus Parcubacteria bacterium]|nr:type II secretion system GspH family protein [Candidatus Parcubacteria bacterium]
MIPVSTKKGFSLIELLVVISIIGLLSSVVFGSLNIARKKARNIATIQAVREYRNVINLYYLQYGTYPYDVANTSGGIGLYCLGKSPSVGTVSGQAVTGRCGMVTQIYGVEGSPLNQQLGQYLPSLATPNAILINAYVPFWGAEYQVSGSASNPTILFRYALEGPTNSCVLPGATTITPWDSGGIICGWDPK